MEGILIIIREIISQELILNGIRIRNRGILVSKARRD